PSTLQTQRQLAASRAVKIAVRQEGWYRVLFADLVAAGLDPRTDASLLRLFAEGSEVPLAVTRDAIQFYGLGLDTPSTATRVYWLGGGPGRGRRLALAPRATGQAAPRSFRFTVERRDRTIYTAAPLAGEGGQFFGPVVATEPVEQRLTLRNLDPRPPGPALL